MLRSAERFHCGLQLRIVGHGRSLNFGARRKSGKFFERCRKCVGCAGIAEKHDAEVEAGAIRRNFRIVQFALALLNLEIGANAVGMGDLAVRFPFGRDGAEMVGFIERALSRSQLCVGIKNTIVVRHHGHDQAATGNFEPGMGGCGRGSSKLIFGDTNAADCFCDRSLADVLMNGVVGDKFDGSRWPAGRFPACTETGCDRRCWGATSERAMVCSDCAIRASEAAAANAVLADCARLIASSSEMETGGAAACWAAHIVQKARPARQASPEL